MLEVGRPAPDLVFLDGEENEVRLSQLGPQRATVLVFLRHFG